MDLEPDADGRVPTMAYVRVPPDLADALHRPGGVAPEAMHITLLDLGPRGAEDRAKLHKVVAKMAAKHGPISIRVVGHARWLAKDDEGAMGEPDGLTGPSTDPSTSQQDLVTAAVDHPAFQTMFEEMRDAVRQQGIDYEGDHSYSPHITLGRVPHDGNLNPWGDIATGTSVGRHLGVAEGTARTHYVLQMPAEAGALEKAEAVWMSKAEEQQIITGLVFVPGRRDSQGDRLTAKEIERAQREFMLKAQAHGSGGHWVPSDPRIKLVETYIAPQDLVVEDHSVPRGSWVHSVKVPDDVWAKAKRGELLSFSPFGHANRVPEEDA